MENHVAITETYQIPGYSLYDPSVVKKDFTLRAMTTMEEKLRLSNPGLGTLAKVIKRCLITNEDLDIQDLKLFDFMYLMYKTRIVTYGAGYHIGIKCPHCGRVHEVTINLDELKVNEVPSDFKEPFKIGPLPVSQDTLECKLFTLRDLLSLNDESEEFLKKYPEYDGDPSFILELCKRVVSVNGKNVLDLRTYMENLHALDYQYFNSEYAKLTDKFGIDTQIELTCPHCNGKYINELPMTSEFFRPSYYN